MRRTVLLGAVTPILALGVIGLTETLLLAQTPKLDDSPKSTGAAPVEANGTTFNPGPQDTPFGSEVRIDVIAPPVDANPIRQRFIELSRKKAYALDEEQLKREVDAMEADVRELEAWAKAQEAVRVLREITAKHPNTKAAEAANAAIQLLENRHAAVRAVGPVPAFGPTWQPLGPVPQPEPRFERQDRLPPEPDGRREKQAPRVPQPDPREKAKQPVSRLD